MSEKTKNADCEIRRENSEQPNFYKSDELKEFAHTNGGPWYESFLLRNGEPL